jgi:hypothetical protein
MQAYNRGGLLWMPHHQADNTFKQARGRTFDEMNIFYPTAHPDMPVSERDGAKQKALKIGVRMAHTPLEEFPDWDPNKKKLINPTFWEQYAAAAHSSYGSVGSMNATQAKKYKQKMDAVQKKLNKKSSTASQKPPLRAPKQKVNAVVNPYTFKKKKATVPEDPRQESYIFL